MTKILDLIAGWGIFAVVFFCRNNLLRALGGSVLLMGLFPFFLVWGHLNKMRREASLLNMVLFFLMCLGLCNFMLKQGAVPPSIAIVIYNAIAASIGLTILFLLKGSLYTFEEFQNRQGLLYLRARYLWATTRFILFAIMDSLLLSLIFSGEYERHPVWRVGLGMVSSCFLTVPVFLLFVVWSTRRSGEDKLDFLVRKDGSDPSESRVTSRKGFAVVMILYLLLGISLEILSRGELLLWIETLGVIVLTASVVWTIRVHKYGTAPAANEPTDKSFLTPTDFVIEVGLQTLFLMAMVFVLIELLDKTLK